MEIAISLGTFLMVNVLAWITPGPNMFAVMSASLTHGRKHGVMTGFGMASAAFLWALSAVLGVALVFEQFPKAVVALKLAGAAYLVWLGVKSLNSAFGNTGSKTAPQIQARRLSRSFRTGFIVSITNPKAALFYGAIMTAVIPASSPNWFLGGIVVLCGLLAAALHAVTATVFSTETAIAAFRNAKRWISGALGLMFIGFGGALAFAALRRS